MPKSRNRLRLTTMPTSSRVTHTNTMAAKCCTDHEPTGGGGGGGQFSL